MSYRVINGVLYGIEDLKPKSSNTYQNNQLEKTKNDFNSFLTEAEEKQDTFKISSHASERLKAREINLSKEDMTKINDGINKADEKGARESVLLYKDLVFIASIKNRTLITAMDKKEAESNVFTNIDSVVLIWSSWT